MAKIINKTAFQLKFAIYRADGLLLSADTPKIDTGTCLKVKEGDTKGIDWFIVLVFLKDSIIPPAVNITQQVSGVGVTLGLSISSGGSGVGFTLGVNTVGTETFSVPLAGQVIGDNDNYELSQSGLQFIFTKLQTDPSCDKVKTISDIINRN
jgi:hypothetical protein